MRVFTDTDVLAPWPRVAMRMTAWEENRTRLPDDVVNAIAAAYGDPHRLSGTLRDLATGGNVDPVDLGHAIDAAEFSTPTGRDHHLQAVRHWLIGQLTDHFADLSVGQ